MELRLLTNLLHTSFHEYITSKSGSPTLQHAFEPISDLQPQTVLPEPIRLFFDGNHYDAIVNRRYGKDSLTPKSMSKPLTRLVWERGPIPVQQIARERGPIARETVEIVAPQASDRVNNGDWMGMRTRYKVQKKYTAKKNHQCNALPVQSCKSVPLAPVPGENAFASTTFVAGAPYQASPNDQLGRDVMGRTIVTDGMQRLLPSIRSAQNEIPRRLGLEDYVSQGATQAHGPLRIEPALAPPPSKGNPRIVLEPKAVTAR